MSITIRTMADGDGSARRTNRRGNATRENMLRTAVKALATGDPAGSANKIAREIGATWGAVKYQFGDNDGLWAAVLHTPQNAGPTYSPSPTRQRHCASASPTSSTRSTKG